MSSRIQVRPFEHRSEYEGMVDYFLGGGEPFLRGMGVNPAKLPSREAWVEAALIDRALPDEQRDRFFLAWLFDDELVGHSSISHIAPGEQAHIHLHLWRPQLRRDGLGSAFFARSIDVYFERFKLRRIVCEPWAENPAPNRVLEKLGFRFVKRYRTVPTAMADEQDVNRYELTREEWSVVRDGSE